MSSLKMAAAGAAILVALDTGLALAGALLTVGPGRQFDKPSAALLAARDGDTIEIDTAGDYGGDVAYVRANDLTIRGVGGGRALLDARGTVAGRKGIFVTKGRNIVIENIEFRNAGGEVNAAGIRAEGADLTVRNCRFHECRDALLGGAGAVLIEYSEFSHCGHNANPATHNLYISQHVTNLIYRYNYSHHSYEGHLLKSRARESWVLCNRITDEQGTGSAVADFPNGGVVVLAGNLLHKGARGQNNRMVAYGMEGIKHATNALFVVHNTMLWENRRAAEMAFVHVPGAPAGFTPVIRNNICVGRLRLTSSASHDAAGNLLFDDVAAAGFVDAARFDFRLRPSSPCIDKGVPPGHYGQYSLLPSFQYVHPAGREPRLPAGAADVGAYEFSD